MTEIGEILKEDLVELLGKLGLDNIEAIEKATDEELLQIPGIGQATLKKLRAWQPSAPIVEKEDAKECVSLRYLVFGELNVAPGDIIPEEFAEEQVLKGKARWR